MSSELWFDLYTNIFLSQHPLGPKLDHKSVAKAVKCSTSIVQYWLNRWKQSKNLNDSGRIGQARATSQKQDQQVVSRVEQQTFIRNRDIMNQLNRKRAREWCDDTRAKYNQPLSKPLLTENHLKMGTRSQSYELEPSDLL